MVSTDLALEILLGVPSITTAAGLIWLQMMKEWIEEKKRDLDAGKPAREKYVAEHFPTIQKEANEATLVAAQFSQDPDTIHQLNQKLNGMSDSLDELEKITQAKSLLIPAMRRIRDIGTLLIVVTGVVGLVYGLYYDVLANVSSLIVGLFVELLLIAVVSIASTSAADYRSVLRLLRKRGLWRTE